MTTLGEVAIAAKNRREGATAQKPVATVAPKPRSADQILAAAKARIEACRQRARQTPDSEIVQVVVALLESRELLQNAYDELNRAREVLPGASRQLTETRKELDQVQADLNYFLDPEKEEGEEGATFDGRKYRILLSVEQANRIVALRSAARPWSDAIRATVNPDAKAISAFLDDPEGNIGPFVTDIDEKSPLKRASWGRRHLASVMPEDEVITDVVVAFGEMVTAFVAKKEKEDDDVVQLLDHAGYFISDDEVQELRRSPDSAADLTQFLGGKSNLAVLGCRNGESLVLERRAGKVYPYKASGPRIGRMAFLFRDQKSGGALKAIERARLRPLEVTGTDTSKVWHDQIKEALDFQLRREAQNAERREVSRELKDMTNLMDPITTYELGTLNKVGTCLMSYRLYKEDGRFVDVVYRLASDGTGVWVSDFVPGAIEKADPNGAWLAKMLGPEKPMPISELRKLREWKEASRLNGYTEAHWQTEREAKRLNATWVNRTNLKDLTGIEGGTDGTFAFTTSVRRKSGVSGKVFWVEGGFAFERRGSEVRCIWTTPNVSRERDKMGNEFVKITDLPDAHRYVLQSLYLGINKLRGEGAWKKAPIHLQRKVETDTPQEEETEE